MLKEIINDEIWDYKDKFIVDSYVHHSFTINIFTQNNLPYNVSKWILETPNNKMIGGYTNNYKFLINPMNKKKISIYNKNAIKIIKQYINKYLY